MAPPSKDWAPSSTWVLDPNYPDYNEDQGLVGTATCIAFSVLSLVTLVARLLTRWGIGRKLGIDDLIIFISWVSKLPKFFVIIFPYHYSEKR
jgi:hypothetical protein